MVHTLIQLKSVERSNMLEIRLEFTWGIKYIPCIEGVKKVNQAIMSHMENYDILCAVFKHISIQAYDRI